MNRTNLQFQEIINAGRSSEDIAKQYQEFIDDEYNEFKSAETLPEKIKEACDVIIVAEVVELHGHIVAANEAAITIEHMSEFLAINLGCCDKAALQKVVDSNFSKMFAQSEIQNALEHFKNLGILVNIKKVGEDLYGAFSAYNQEVNGKHYPLDKLLKAHTYKAVDESIEWWL